MQTDYLRKLTMKLVCENNELLSFNKASLLQGVLMESIGQEYAEQLHADGIKPYSQSIINKNGENIWQIRTLTEEAGEKIIKPLMEESFQSFKIEHNDLNVKIQSRELETREVSDLYKDFYSSDADRTYIIEFLSPTAFRRDERYVFQPELYLIYQSIMRKMDVLSTDNNMFNKDTLDQLAANSFISAYSLYSVNFSLEGVRIPAFMGQVTVKIKGTQTMTNFARMLFEFGNYSGVGIKTAIGMGNIHIEPKRKQGGKDE